jgi:hypothetical protein
VVVWPVYVGVTNNWGGEPLGDYQRGQIQWRTEEDGTIYGRGTIIVPKGYYTHLVYFYHPTSPLTVGHQQLSHPFDFKVPGVIDVDRIGKDDFTQLRTVNGFRLPV